MKDNIFRNGAYNNDGSREHHDDVFRTADLNPTHPERGWDKPEVEKDCQKNRIADNDITGDSNGTIIEVDILEIDYVPVGTIETSGFSEDVKRDISSDMSTDDGCGCSEK